MTYGYVEGGGMWKSGGGAGHRKGKRVGCYVLRTVLRGGGERGEGMEGV